MTEAALTRLQGPVGGPSPPWAWALHLASWGWGLGARLHRLGWTLRGAWHPPVPTISVGSPTAGGAGKTPITRWIAEVLVAAGRRPAILTRGYGGEAAGAAPRRALPTDDARLVGDEAALLARWLPEVAVVVCADRRRGARWAVDAGADALILDDGLQHHALGRHLDVVLAPADRPPWGDALIPAGRLREGAEAVRRGQLPWVHGGAARWPAALVPAGAPQVVSTLRVEEVALPKGRRLPPGALRGEAVGLWTGIARPKRVEASLEELGANLRWRRAEADHAPLEPAALVAFCQQARRAGARWLLLTEKDGVKLPAALETAIPVGVLRARLSFLEGEAAARAALTAVLAGEHLPSVAERGP